ncbi:hypothetical protein [Streptomyces sp. NBC_00842]|uniref:hypothetical protein n=1 Tax=Streptomyces sp. NBC_00842 TaxID=2975848 RepID=UPI003868E6BA
MGISRFGIPEKLADRMTMAEQHDHLRTRLTRRGVLRTSVATAAVAGAGVSTGLAASPASAAPTVLTSRTSTQADGSPVLRVQPGRHARLKVTALAESGERGDHFEISRG